ncbi:MAG: hypothetical protein Rubg2KO_19130 [Rubricoccaceae bacterium]
MRCLLLLLFGIASAQAQPVATLVVDAQEGVVVMDGEEVAAPGEALALSTGEHLVWLVDDVEAWNPRIDSARVELVAGDTLRLSMALPIRTRIESQPVGAEITLVTADGAARPLGVAPVTVDLPDGALAELVAELDGYVTVRRSVDASPLVRLELAAEPGIRVEPMVQTFATRRAARRRTLIDLGIGAATLAAGAVAVYYKFEADEVDDRYRDPESLQRGDEVLRQEALSLDRRSGVALGAMQVGLGVLALRFVLR